MRRSHFLFSVIALGAAATLLGAQERPRTSRPRVSISELPGDHDPDRAALGVGIEWGGRRDTLGLLVASVTPDGPADKAGLEEGNRLAAINGVDLRVAPADVEEEDVGSAMHNRLVRELRRVKAGDEVELRVYSDGRFRTVRVKTVAMGDVHGARARRGGEESGDRAVLGLTLGGGGSRRDSLGVLVTGLQADGPAERAGIEEGNRIAAVNGVDLRAQRDQDDEYGGNARSERFTREMQKVRPGDEVELRVYSDGRFRTVRVKAARESEVYKNRPGFRYRGDWPSIAPAPPVPPVPPVAPRAPRPPRSPRVETGPMEIEIEAPELRFDKRHEQHERDIEREAEWHGREMKRHLREHMREMERDGKRHMHVDPEHRVRVKVDPRVRLDLERRLRSDMERQMRDDVRRRAIVRARAAEVEARAHATSRARAARAARLPTIVRVAPGEIERAEIVREPIEAVTVPAPALPARAYGVAPGRAMDRLYVEGMRLAPVTADMAEYFGELSEGGLLVIEAGDAWTGLRGGDVILRVNGARVRDGDHARIGFDLDGRNDVELLRKGERIVVQIDRRD